MEQDESTEPEVPPQQQHTLSGMGGGEHAGKYDGFGNSPIQKGIFAIENNYFIFMYISLLYFWCIVCICYTF